MARARKRDRLRWSKLYTFSCFGHPHTDEAAGPAAVSGRPVGGPGFSRIVHCNNSILHRRKPLKYPTNYISTTKYNVLTFLPKAIFEQFRRVANLSSQAVPDPLPPSSPFSILSLASHLFVYVFFSNRSMNTSSLEPPLPDPRPRHASGPPVVPHPPEGAVVPRSSAAAAGLVSLRGRRAPRSLTSASSSPAPPSRFLARFSSPPSPALPR